MGIGKTDLDKLNKYNPGGRQKNPWFKPRPDGNNERKYPIRLLPPAEGRDLPFHDEDLHYLGDFKDRDAPKGVCPDSGQDKDDCPSCDYFWTLRDVVDDDDLKEALSVLRPNTRTYVNLIERGNEVLGPQVWSMPYGVASEIIAMARSHAEDGVDIFDPRAGRDIVVRCVPQGTAFRYKAMVKPKSSAVDVEGWESDLPDLRGIARSRVLSVEEIQDYLPTALGEFWDVLNGIYLRVKEDKGESVSPAAMPDLGELSYRQLQKKAKGLGLSGAGSADDLRERIEAHLS